MADSPDIPPVTGFGRGHGTLAAVRRALPLLLLLTAGCGSAPPSELPPPAAVAPSPPLTREPAGRALPAAAARASVDDGRQVELGGRTVRGDREAGVLLVDGRPVRVPGLLAPDGVAATADGDLLVVDAKRRRLVRLQPRTLAVRDAAPAGVGPTRVVAGGSFAYVSDTAGDALLVFSLEDGEVDPIRYVHLPGSPAAMTIDRRSAYRVWVALPARNEVVGLPAHGRPRPIERVPTVRAPSALGADPATGRVTVLGDTAAVSFTP